MKQFLVLLAVLPLMLIFLLQFSIDRMNHARTGLLSDCVYIAKEQARAKGCFTREISEELKGRISEVLEIDSDSVLVEATREPQYRVQGNGYAGDGVASRGLIYYKVSVPMGQIMAAPRLFGIREEDNQLLFTLEGWTASELLP